MSRKNTPDEITYPWMHIPRELWRAAKAQAAAETPPRTMKAVLLALLTAWTKIPAHAEPRPRRKIVGMPTSAGDPIPSPRPAIKAVAPLTIVERATPDDAETW